jgi:membrane protease YdiL (CAAX protease family)
MKIIRILEITWLCIAIAGVLFGAYKFNESDWGDRILLFMFTFVAGIFYYIRRRQRIRMEQENHPE